MIAWSLEDAPSRSEVERVLDEFEETAWAGLDRDRYIWSAVQHRDHAGGVHVHIFAARCDLATGRSLNIAPPGWQKTFDPLRDAFNYEHGWSRPDDPARARPYRPSPHLAYLDAETLRAGWEVEPDRRALIGEHLLGRVTEGAVKDRAGVVAALEGLGFEVPRQGRHYVTILRPETGERLRLKGGLYEADFDRERFMRQREPSGDRERADRGADAKRAADAWRDLEEKRLKRAEYHRSRYGGGGRARAGGARDAAGAVERESGPVAAAVERAAVPESLAEHLRKELGDEAVVAAVDSMVERDRDLEAIRGAAAGDATACLAVLARVGVVDDRDRATAEDGVAGVVHAVRAGAEAAGRTDRGLAEAGRGLAATVRSARACDDALDRGIRDAGRDLWRALSTRVAGLEEAVCATSKGEPWLVEAQEAVLEGADRRLPLSARARAVKTVEGRLRAELADREETLRATSAGAVMLREEYGDRIASAARLQSFASREDVLERIEERVDAELETREEELRSIPLGKECLREAEQARPGGVAGPLPLVDRESMVNVATKRVEEEFDKREKGLAARAGHENLLVEVAGNLNLEGGTLTLGERWRVIEASERRVEEEHADLEGREAAILEDPAGAAFLSDAQREVLGDADREAKTLAARGRVIQAAEAALQKAAKRQADQEWENKKAVRERALARLPGGTSLYYAHLADLDPQWGVNGNTTTTRENIDSALTAAESDDTRLKRLRDVLSAEADATCYQEVLDQVVGQFKTSDLDNALAAGEKARAERETQQWEEKRDALVDELGALPGGMDLFHAHLADRDPKWDLKRNRKSSSEHIDAALGAAKSDAPRLERLRGVLSDEADVACYQGVLDQVVGQFRTSDLDNALAAGEKARAERETQQWKEKRDALVDELGALPGGMDLFHAHLADRDPKWDLKRNRKSSSEHIDAALGAAKSDAPRLERLRGVLSDEAAGIRYREDLGQVDGQYTTSDLDRALAAAEQAREHQAALRTATAATQAAATRSNVKLHDGHVRVIYATGETHATGLAAVDRTTEALALAADQELPTETIVDTWKANQSDPGGIAAALDRASSAQRVSRLERLFSVPGGDEAFITALDEQDPSWRTGTHPRTINRALVIAGRDLGRETRTPWHAVVLNAEQQFPDATSVTWRRAAEVFAGATAPHARSISQTLSDRARARAFAAGAPEPPPSCDEQRVIDWVRSQVDRLAQRARNSVRPVRKKLPPPKQARRVPDATREDTEPLLRALTDLEKQTTDPDRLAQRARNSETPVSEKSPPVPGPARLVPAATREDAVAAAPLIVRARLPEAAQQELRLGVDIAARELAGEFGSCQWWSHAGGELEELHSREDRYLALNDTTKDPVEIGMLRTVLEKNVYEEAFRLVEHPAAAADPPTNLAELVRAFIRRLQEAVDRLIDRVLDREPAHLPRPAAAADQVPARPALQPPVAPPDPSLRQPAPFHPPERPRVDLAHAPIVEAHVTEPPVIAVPDRHAPKPPRPEPERDPRVERDIARLKEVGVPDELLNLLRATPTTATKREQGDAAALERQQLEALKLARLVPAATSEDADAAALERQQLEALRARTGAVRLPETEASAAEDPPRLTFKERYSRQWSGHVADIHRPDFAKLVAGASARDKLFERQEHYSSGRRTVEPEALPIALAKPAPAWDDETVKSVTCHATSGVGIQERTESRRIVDAHLGHYEYRLPEQYAHSAEWRAIRERAEEAVRKLLDTWRYKRKDDRKKREREATAINRACGREARHLHEKMIAEREAARPDWEVTVRIRDVQQSIRKEEADRRAREQEPVYRSYAPEPSRAPGPTINRGR